MSARTHLSSPAHLPATSHSKPLLPITSCILESHCPSTAGGTSDAPWRPAPSKPPQWYPLAQAQLFPRKCKRCPCPLLAYLPAALPLHAALLQAAAWVSASLLEQGGPSKMESPKGTASIKSSWEQISSSVQKDICLQLGGKKCSVHQSLGYRHPLETNPAMVPSSTALPDHAGLATIIKQPLLKKDLGGQDCVAVTIRPTLRRSVFMKLFEADRSRMKLILTSPPSLISQLQDITCPSLDFALLTATHIVNCY